MKTISYLLSILLLVLCVMIPSTALVIPIGGLLDDPLMQGTIAIDDSGNMAYTLVAVLNGEFTSQQFGYDEGYAGVTQVTQASTEDGAIFLGSGAYDAHGSFAATGDLLVGEGEISLAQNGVAGYHEGSYMGVGKRETIAVEDGSAYSGTIAMDSLLFPENYLFTGNRLSGTGTLNSFQNGQYFDEGVTIAQKTTGSLESGEAHTLTYVPDGPVWSHDYYAISKFEIDDFYRKIG